MRLFGMVEIVSRLPGTAASPQASGHLIPPSFLSSRSDWLESDSHNCTGAKRCVRNALHQTLGLATRASLSAVPGCAQGRPYPARLTHSQPPPRRAAATHTPICGGPGPAQVPRPLTPRGHHGNLRARQFVSREAQVLCSQSSAAPGARRWKRSLGGAAHAQSGGARQAPALHLGGLCSEQDARPEANWEAESDVNRTSQPVSPAALRRRCDSGEGGDDDCDGLPGSPKWEWCGLQEGERKRSRSGPQRPTLTAFLSADRLGPRPARSTVRAAASGPRPLGPDLVAERRGGGLLLQRRERPDLRRRGMWVRAEPAREGPRGLSLADTRTFACSRGFADCGQPEAPGKSSPLGLGGASSSPHPCGGWVLLLPGLQVEGTSCLSRPFHPDLPFPPLVSVNSARKSSFLEGNLGRSVFLLIFVSLCAWYSSSPLLISL